MKSTSLRDLADEHLERANAASSGRSAATVYGGQKHDLRQTLIALAEGQSLGEHESPGEATLQVLSGQVRLVAGEETWQGTAGDHLVIPPSRHDLTAVTEAVVLLTVATGASPRSSGGDQDLPPRPSVSSMRVAIGAPGNGSVLKDEIKDFLEQDGRVSEVLDLTLPDITYPAVSLKAAQAVVNGDVHRAILVCGTGVGTAIAASKVAGARAATAHDLVTVRGAVENYDAQILCMGQNVIAPAHARALVDLWLDLRHDPTGSYGPKLREIDDYETRR